MDESSGHEGGCLVLREKLEALCSCLLTSAVPIALVLTIRKSWLWLLMILIAADLIRQLMSKHPDGMCLPDKVRCSCSLPDDQNAGKRADSGSAWSMGG